jgi:hypothetical protein
LIGIPIDFQRNILAGYGLAIIGVLGVAIDNLIEFGCVARAAKITDGADLLLRLGYRSRRILGLTIARAEITIRGRNGKRFILWSYRIGLCNSIRPGVGRFNFAVDISCYPLSAGGRSGSCNRNPIL